MNKFTRKQWFRFALYTVLWLLFSLWVESFWLLLALPIIFDSCLTKRIRWSAWREVRNPQLRYIFTWIDDVLFALVVVYMINLFFFQNYQIPTSSLEKSLMVGDFLFVSKASYGSRMPNTPIAFPLVQNTLPITGTKSYLDWPSWEYKRLKGFGEIERNDIVVFNFPAGDTVALNMQNPDYYTLLEEVGRVRIALDKSTFGEVVYRPVDRRENYVKRCIGLPGDSLSIVDNQVYINGAKGINPKNVQYNYYLLTTGMLSEEQFRLLDVSNDDRTLITDRANPQTLSFLKMQALPENAGAMPIYKLPLTPEALEKAKNLSIVKEIVIEPEALGGAAYPVNYNTNWTRDNYGPIYIPKKGDTVELNEKNIAIYRRCIVNYEGNTLKEENGTFYINGEKATSYTFAYDYYWMMGDNRHNSADSRYWGFVPEDHVVGKPIMVWLSVDKDRSLFDGYIRWERLFRWVDDL